MISITRAQVPSYLTGGEFYNALCPEDDEEFSVPIANFKRTPEVSGIEDAVYLLRTMQYWGVSTIPDAFVAYLVTKHSLADYTKLCVLLWDFEPEAKLVELLHALQTLRDTCFHFDHKAVHRAVLVLMHNLLSPSDAVSDQARTVLLEAVEQEVGFAKTDVIGHLLSIVDKVNDTTSTCCKRNVVHIYATVLDRGPYPRAPLPLFLELLFSDDAETVEHSSRALMGIIQSSSPMERDEQFSLAVAERYVELLESENSFIQWAAVCAVRYFVRPSDKWANRMIELGLLPKLHNILCGQVLHHYTLSDTISTLTHMCSYSNPNLQLVIDAGLLNRVVQLHKSGALRDVVHSEDWLWSSVVSAATDTQMYYLARIELAPVLFDILRSSADYTKDKGSINRTFRRFLKCCKQDPILWQEVTKTFGACDRSVLEKIATNADDVRSCTARSRRKKLVLPQQHSNRELYLVIIFAILTACAVKSIQWMQGTAAQT